MPAHHVILDCDPGLDDAVAIFLAVASPAEIELVGLTTVAGNCTLPIVDANARRILAFVGQERIPVATGCHRRWGLPEEVARLIAFLALPGSGSITGAIVPIDGGFTIRGDPGEDIGARPASMTLVWQLFGIIE
jgi:NAD(P)-dependent dehydrogenase (short-subunit alcohol dehydrogenase family)